MGKIGSGKGRKIKPETGTRTFHRFPELTSPIGKKWVQFVRNKLSDPNWTPQRKHKLCSKHFTETSFVTSAIDKCKALKENAIPSKLILPDKKVEPQTKKAKQKKKISRYTTCATEATVLYNLRELPNSKDDLINSIKFLKHKIQKAEKLAAKRSASIKFYEERGRKLEDSRDELMSKLMVYMRK